MSLTQRELDFVAELKACPCCGRSVGVRYDPEEIKVECGTCGMNTGPRRNIPPGIGSTQEWEAKVTWNNRVGDIRYGIY